MEIYNLKWTVSCDDSVPYLVCTRLCMYDINQKPMYKDDTTTLLTTRSLD